MNPQLASVLDHPLWRHPALRHPLLGVAITGVLLTGTLGWLVSDRVSLMRQPTEIVLPIRPVDPRDLFRGDYVRLDYGALSRIDAKLLPKSDAGRGRRPVFVTIERNADETWRPVAVSLSKPVNVAAGQIVLAARSGPYGFGQISYGLERYYVQEGKGRPVEDMARSGKMAVVVAVDGDGRTAIKGIMLDGRRIHTEPVL